MTFFAPFFAVGRTDPNLDDLGLSFQDHNIRLDELEAYVQHVDAVPFAHKVEICCSLSARLCFQAARKVSTFAQICAECVL